MNKKDGNFLMYLDDILTALLRIAEYIGGYDFEQFKKDNRTVDAVIRNFGIIEPSNLKEVEYV